MTTKAPKRKLPPEAEAWGRWIENQVQAQASEITRLRQQNRNAFRGVNTAISAIADQVSALDLVTQEIAAAQEELAEQQSQISAIIDDQILVLTASDGITTTVPPTSYGTACSMSFAVPSWANSCSVIGSAGVTMASVVGNSGSVVYKYVIEGVDSTSTILRADATEQQAGAVVGQRSFTPTDSTVNVLVQWYRQNDWVSGASVNAVAFAIFTR